MSVLTTKEIMEIIPHRQPMLLIDTIEELEEGKRAVGKKCVSYNEPYFGGHFPQEPVMPGDRGSPGPGGSGGYAEVPGISRKDRVFWRH